MRLNAFKENIIKQTICAKHEYILYVFAYVFDIFAAFHPPYNGGPAAEGLRPTVVEAAEGRLHYGGW